jgi:hypothetical protein
VRRWVVVGNPPFGKNSSLAVRFFNKAAEFADVIAFVVPLTFRKQSLQRRLKANFELVAETALGDDAFVFEGKACSVPCAFQVWRKTAVSREHVLLPLTHEDFEFCQAAEADFAIRRVGAMAGRVLRDFKHYSAGSNVFIRSNIDADELARRFETINWDDTRCNTAGNPSISKRELVAKYAERSNLDAATTPEELPTSAALPGEADAATVGDSKAAARCRVLDQSQRQDEEAAPDLVDVVTPAASDERAGVESEVDRLGVWAGHFVGAQADAQEMGEGVCVARQQDHGPANRIPGMHRLERDAVDAHGHLARAEPAWVARALGFSPTPSDGTAVGATSWTWALARTRSTRQRCLDPPRRWAMQQQGAVWCTSGVPAALADFTSRWLLDCAKPPGNTWRAIACA